MRRLAMLMIACLTPFGTLHAQTFPDRAITIVVPFAAGGSTDLVSRMTADGLSKALGVPVIVENTTGAGGTIASTRVAKASPDGYTLLVHHVGIASAATLYRSLPFDTRTAFQPLGLLTHTPSVLISRRNLEANTLSELVAYIKKNKTGVSFGNAGVGAASHLCGMLLQVAIGEQMNTIPYRGNGPVLNDLLSQQLDLTCDQATGVTSQVKAKSVKAFAVTSTTRLADLADVPTADEAGLKGFEFSVWHGIYAPAGTPQPAIDRLSAAIQATLRDQTYIAKMRDINTTVASSAEATPAGHKQKLLSEIDRWAPVIRAAGQFAD